MRLAICDDDEDFRRLLEGCVRADPDFELVATADAVQPLLHALPSVEVEGVLLDWLMPGMDRAEAVRAVRAALPEAQIVVLSAVLRSAAEDHARAAGADGYVEKGPGARELLDACRRILLAGE